MSFLSLDRTNIYVTKCIPKFYSGGRGGVGSGSYSFVKGTGGTSFASYTPVADTSVDVKHVCVRRVSAINVTAHVLTWVSEFEHTLKSMSPIVVAWTRHALVRYQSVELLRRPKFGVSVQTPNVITRLTRLGHFIFCIGDLNPSHAL